MATLPTAVAQAVAERRLGLRIPVNQPVRVYAGRRSLRARLTQLSLTGCRLRFFTPVSADGALWIWLPGGFGGRLPQPIRGDVVRVDPGPGQTTCVSEVAVQFRPMRARTHRRLSRVLTEVLSGESERREAERVPYRRRVIARGADHPRVLIGQDLSLGGMRIDGPVDLPVDSEIQLALHAGGALEVLVVDARVVRHDRPEGAGLAFVGLDERKREHLSKLVHQHLPFTGSDGRPAVVSEIVGEQGEDTPEPGSDDEAGDGTPSS